MLNVIIISEITKLGIGIVNTHINFLNTFVHCTVVHPNLGTTSETQLAVPSAIDYICEVVWGSKNNPRNCSTVENVIDLPAEHS